MYVGVYGVYVCTQSLAWLMSSKYVFVFCDHPSLVPLDLSTFQLDLAEDNDLEPYISCMFHENQ